MMTDTLVQIIVASHGDLACALVRAAELIAGPQEDVFCLALMPGDDVRVFQTRLADLAGLTRPALIMVDMMGGTPWNVALAVAPQNEQIRVISGVNLPMLLEVTFSRPTMRLDQLVTLAQETGIQAMQTWPSRG